MIAGGVYLVGALRDGNSESSQKCGMKLGGVNRAEQTETLVFARVARVGGAMIRELAGPETQKAERVGSEPPHSADETD